MTKHEDYKSLYQKLSTKVRGEYYLGRYENEVFRILFSKNIKLQ
ncbi:MAG: hypothetical protein RMJ37_03205 [Spirochaetia bacterium]|nr:hypothetical protein [Spirochaetota bacterium]MDW8112334.1 hypothetical protein [Spirochaetia bacterium]